MPRYAVINKTTGIVENMIEWEPEESDWIPTGDEIVIFAGDKGGPGDYWDSSSWQFLPSPPPPPPPPSEMELMERRVKALEEAVTAFRAAATRHTQ